MKYSDIRENKTYEQLGKELGISTMAIYYQINKRGLTRQTMIKLIDQHPDIDIKDLIYGYPIKKD